MSHVTLDSAVKKYGDLQVIHGVDLQIEQGEFCVFVGPSGCGKSTLLRMVAGLEETNGGRIHIGGRDVTHVDAAKRGVAMVFQTYALYPHMSVRENMGFGLRMSGLSKLETAKKVDEAARILKLEEYLDRKPKALSGGQRQRVAIGRAIVRAPEVFLFDEPLSNLDAELRVQMRLEIARLHRQLGATMIYVTHDQVEAMTLADKIVVLRAGKIEQVGSPIELYEDPNNLFVAQFIGSPKMNALPGQVVQQVNGRADIRMPDLPDVTLPMQLKTSVRPGQDVVVGMRPQNFSNDGDLTVRIQVEAIENLGGVGYAYAILEGSPDPFCVELRRTTSTAGREIETRFETNSGLLFDATNGARIR